MRRIDVRLDAEVLHLIRELQSATGQQPAALLEAALERYHQEVFHKSPRRKRKSRRDCVKLVRRK